MENTEIRLNKVKDKIIKAIENNDFIKLEYLILEKNKILKEKYKNTSNK